MKIPSKIKIFFRAVLFVVPIIIAILIVSKLSESQKEPERSTLQERSQAVRVIPIQPLNVVPRVLGYGYVKPEQVWEAVPEVGGKIIETHACLKQGMFCKKGDALIRIDPAEYDLAIAQQEASIENINAQIAELDAKEQNYNKSLELEQKNLELAKKELDRQKKLLDQKTVAQSVYDKQEQSYYAQQMQVQNLKNSLNLIPAQRKALNANLKVNQVNLQDARLNRQRTTIKAPFDCRVTEVKTEISQFVQPGQSLAAVDGTSAVEIIAQIPLGKMLNLMNAMEKRLAIPELQSELDLETFMNTQKLRELITVRVRIKAGDRDLEWDAEPARSDASINVQTRTIGVIVLVRNPYQLTRNGARKPPLVRNAFCEVEMSGPNLQNVLIIPRSALHDGQVYVVNGENRLVKKPVAIDFSQTDFYVIEEGLQAGERLIVSDLIPAIDGMLLNPVDDPELQESLIAQASGKTGVK